MICRLLGHRYWSATSWGSTERHCVRCGHPRPNPAANRPRETR